MTEKFAPEQHHQVDLDSDSDTPFAKAGPAVDPVPARTPHAPGGAKRSSTEPPTCSRSTDTTAPA